jgi:hypothetical protein
MTVKTFILFSVLATNLNAATTNITKRFEYDGRIYFNATHSGMHGEDYLLNEQLSNVKLNSHFNLSEQVKLRALFTYNTIPVPSKSLTLNKAASLATLNLQSGYKFKIKNLPAEMIGFYEHSYQSLVLKLPKKKIGVGLNLSLSRYVNIQFQYFTTYKYAKQNRNLGDTLVGQLVVNC